MGGRVSGRYRTREGREQAFLDYEGALPFEDEYVDADGDVGADLETLGVVGSLSLCEALGECGLHPLCPCGIEQADVELDAAGLTVAPRLDAPEAAR